MIRIAKPCLALTAIFFVSGSSLTHAGPPGCGCSGNSAAHSHPSFSSPSFVHSAPEIHGSYEMHSDPEIDTSPDVQDAYEPSADCGCACAVPSCCGVGGVGGGLMQLGNLYGSTGVYGYHGSPDPRSFESGFENLPDMDGGGVHHRLPFHSYRRPWAHPGIADTNINIVW